MLEEEEKNPKWVDGDCWFSCVVTMELHRCREPVKFYYFPSIDEVTKARVIRRKNGFFDGATSTLSSRKISTAIA